MAKVLRGATAFGLLSNKPVAAGSGAQEAAFLNLFEHFVTPLFVQIAQHTEIDK